MTQCTDVQERIALGESLLDEESRHLASCERCSRVAEMSARLDASLESLFEPVPDGFADRVMHRLSASQSIPARSWLDAPWVELALANAALVCALVNAVRFLAGVLLPSVSLGGTP
ncbi:MAG TPA: hypothetical protein VER12_16975 [Polyangiaceae bacterium]|nr:hypothetical protein [Polyangiaceae bacterium]